MRAGEHLRLISANLRVAVVRDQTSFSIFTDRQFTPQEVSAQPFASMFDDRVLWGGALVGAREKRAAMTDA